MYVLFPFSAQLEKERKKKAQVEEILFRKSLMADFQAASVTPSRGLVTPSPSRNVQQSKGTSPVPNSILKKTTTPSATKTTFVIETPTNYSISVRLYLFKIIHNFYTLISVLW